jgi:hypothetical protein
MAEMGGRLKIRPLFLLQSHPPHWLLEASRSPITSRPMRGSVKSVEGRCPAKHQSKDFIYNSSVLSDSNAPYIYHADKRVYIEIVAPSENDDGQEK